MAARAKRASPNVTSQLGLFEVLDVGPTQPRTDLAAPTSLAEVRSRDRASVGGGALPRLCVKPEEAARMLSVSRDYFDEHVKSELRVVHRGRTVLVPVAELVRWVERNAACYSD